LEKPYLELTQQLIKENKFKQCYICKDMAITREHHLSYLPQIIIKVCTSCHNKIHRGKLKQYCQFTRRQKLIFYKRKGHLEFREYKNQIRVPLTKEEKKRFPDGSGFGWINSRPLTEKEKWLYKEMKKSKVVLE
jgi:hypothetical protein